MNEVVAANGQAVAVAGHLPYGHLWIGNLKTGGNSPAAAMNCVEAVGVHVVRKSRTAADT